MAVAAFKYLVPHSVGYLYGLSREANKTAGTDKVVVPVVLQVWLQQPNKNLLNSQAWFLSHLMVGTSSHSCASKLGKGVLE